jgi:sulfite reductase (ferredoxin)
MINESVYPLPESLSGDLEQLRQLTDRFQKGEISADSYHSFRVPYGIYEQRKSGNFMLRARLAAGILTPGQMRIVAEVSEKYGDGTLHLTSRQDLQVHGVKLEGICPAASKLAEVMLFTKGGGGNTLRNIAACYLAGVCPTEAFDVTPYAIGLTKQLLQDPNSCQLPRKYKIAFSGCSRDCAGASVNDLGFIGKRREGAEGFAVYIGGGMGAKSRVGEPLEEFVPAAQAYRIAEAVKRVFYKHGDRTNRQRARIRFLVESIGIDAFKKYYREELEQLDSSEASWIPAAQAAPAIESHKKSAPADGFDYWFNENITPQKQKGYFAAEIAPPLGLLPAVQIRQLADVIEGFGEGVFRATPWQSVVLRWVSTEQLQPLHAKLASIGLGSGEPAVLRHLVTCTGASICRLGICLSRGLAKAIREAFMSSNLNLKGAAGKVAMNISGCPNACGRHPIGQIGLYGASRKISGHPVPHYVIQFGGHVEEGKTVFAQGAQAVPARDVPAFLVEFLQSFEVSAQSPDFIAYLEAEGKQIAEDLILKYANAQAFSKDENYCFDWGGESAS